MNYVPSSPQNNKPENQCCFCGRSLVVNVQSWRLPHGYFCFPQCEDRYEKSDRP